MSYSYLIALCLNSVIHALNGGPVIDSAWLKELTLTDGEKINATVVKPVGSNYRYVFLLRNGTNYKQRIDKNNRFTLTALGFDLRTMPTASDNFLNSFEEGVPYDLPDFYDNGANGKYIKFCNSSYLLDTFKVLDSLINPSFVHAADGMFISFRLHAATSDSRIILLNRQSGFEFSEPRDIDKDLVILSKIKSSVLRDNNLPHVDFRGEDVRLFLLPRIEPNQQEFESEEGEHGRSQQHKYHHRVFAAFAYRNQWSVPEVNMAYSELVFSKELNTIEKRATNLMHTGGRYDQKNWAPLEYGKKLHFIFSGQPHTIIAPITVDSSESPDNSTANDILTVNIEQKGETALDDDSKSKVWIDLGKIRGGTPAIKIGTKYLTLFHSTICPCWKDDTITLGSGSAKSILQTYAMGAYIFEAEPPFAVTSFTSIPIAHESMYSGEWKECRRRYNCIDYCVFPTSLIMSHDERYMYVLYGKQDVDGWVAKLDFVQLVNSMTTVRSVLVDTPLIGTTPV